VTHSLWPLWAVSGSQQISPVGYLLLAGLPLVVRWTQVGVSLGVVESVGLQGWWGMHTLQGNSVLAPERTIILGYGTLWLHFCSPGSGSSSQHTARCVPFFFEHWPPCTYSWKGWGNTCLAPCFALLLTSSMCRKCKPANISPWIPLLHSLEVQAEFYFLLTVGPGMCLSRAFSFHFHLGLWELHLGFGAISTLPSWICNENVLKGSLCTITQLICEYVKNHSIVHFKCVMVGTSTNDISTCLFKNKSTSLNRFVYSEKAAYTGFRTAYNTEHTLGVLGHISLG
jgi:hypothetical protein